METKNLILCDTNILIDFYKNDKNIVKKFKEIGEENLSISVITQAELFYGALNKKEFNNIKNHLNYFTILPINEEVSKRFSLIMHNYSLSHRINIPDALIASTSLYFNVPLFTKNVRDFKFIPGLKLY